MSSTGQRLIKKSPLPASERGAGQLTQERWLDRWADLLAAQKGPALVLGGRSGLEASLLLGLGFQVAVVDFSAALSAESLQRNPLADHHVTDWSSLGAALTGHFAIIVANLSYHYKPSTVTTPNAWSRRRSAGWQNAVSLR